MLRISAFPYQPNDYERERASFSYLMSLVAAIVGLPLPLINLISTGIYYFSNRKSTRFVRWHCLQALLSQLLLFPMNAAAIYWTLHILFWGWHVTESFVAYIITVLLFNLVEFIMTVIAAVQTRKGRHVEWWIFGAVTNHFIPATDAQ